MRMMIFFHHPQGFSSWLSLQRPQCDEPGLECHHARSELYHARSEYHHARSGRKYFGIEF